MATTTMSTLFWVHCGIVGLGLVMSTLNLYTAIRDAQVAKDMHANADAMTVAFGWIARESIRLVIQLVFVSFIYIFLTAVDPLPEEHKWWVEIVELRSTWISALVLTLAMWDRFMRVVMLR